MDDDRGHYLVQGLKVPDSPDRVEIPHMLLRWLEPDTHLGATLTDSGVGTFILSGESVSDGEALATLQVPRHETCVSVPAAVTPRRW